MGNFPIWELYGARVGQKCDKTINTNEIGKATINASTQMKNEARSIEITEEKTKENEKEGEELDDN